MTLSLTAAVAVIAGGALPAAAAAHPGQASPGPRVCTTVVGKAPTGAFSPVRSTTCVDDGSAPVVASSTLLMEWWQNANNRPTATINRIYGDAGPCDGDGYRVRVEWPWSFLLSGFNTWNSCSIATGYDLPNLSGDRQTWNGSANPCVCVSVGYVGDFMNDRIESFWIRRHY
jgi:hypothetical protein